MRPAISFTANFFVLLLSFLMAEKLTAQEKPAITAQWVKMLGTQSGPVNSGIKEVLAALDGKDLATGFRVLSEIEKMANLENNYFRARFAATKSRWLGSILQPTDSNKNQVINLLTAALNAAYETGNDSLISEMSWAYGITCYQYSKIEPAATYCLLPPN